MKAFRKEQLELIAFAINRSKLDVEDSPEAREALDILTLKLASALKAHNKDFDYNRFLEACGLEVDWSNPVDCAYCESQAIGTINNKPVCDLHASVDYNEMQANK